MRYRSCQCGDWDGGVCPHPERCGLEAPSEQQDTKGQLAARLTVSVLRSLHIPYDEESGTSSKEAQDAVNRLRTALAELEELGA